METLINAVAVSRNDKLMDKNSVHSKTSIQYVFAF